MITNRGFLGAPKKLDRNPVAAPWRNGSQHYDFAGVSWRTREDSNLWPLPSEGSDSGLFPQMFRKIPGFVRQIRAGLNAFLGRAQETSGFMTRSETRRCGKREDTNMSDDDDTGAADALLATRDLLIFSAICALFGGGFVGQVLDNMQAQYERSAE